MRFLVGKKVDDITTVSESYDTVCGLKNLCAFRQPKSIYYYEEELSVPQERAVLCKDTLDQLISLSCTPHCCISANKSSISEPMRSCIQFGQRSQPEGNAAIYQHAVFPGRNFPREPTASVPLCTRVCRLPFPSAKKYLHRYFGFYRQGNPGTLLGKPDVAGLGQKILYQQCILRANLPQCGRSACLCTIAGGTLR